MLTTLPTEDQVEEAADLLMALSNPKRLQIMQQLVNNEVSVGVLAAEVGLSQSALSQHLAKLREAKYVTTRRDAQTVFYSKQLRRGEKRAAGPGRACQLRPHQQTRGRKIS